MVQEERNLYAPHYAGYLGSNLDEAKKLQEKVVKFAPTCKVRKTNPRKFHAILFFYLLQEINSPHQTSDSAVSY